MPAVNVADRSFAVLVNDNVVGVNEPCFVVEMES